MSSAGCLQFLQGRQYRLYFVGIVNLIQSERQVDVRVLRDGSKVFEGSYEMPGNPEERQTREAFYSAYDYTKLLRDEWEPKKATYTVEYRLGGQGKFDQFDISEHLDSDVAGVGVRLEPTAFSTDTIMVNMTRFETEQELRSFYSQATTDETPA